MSNQLSPEEGLIFTSAGIGNYSTLLPWKSQERRTGEPKNLLQCEPAEVSFAAQYDPAAVEYLQSQLTGSQEITVEYGELLYMGSPRGRVDIIHSRIRFRGYLSAFKPDGVELEVEPTATVEIGIVT